MRGARLHERLQAVAAEIGRDGHAVGVEFGAGQERVGVGFGGGGNVVALSVGNGQQPARASHADGVFVSLQPADAVLFVESQLGFDDWDEIGYGIEHEFVKVGDAGSKVFSLRLAAK